MNWRNDGPYLVLALAIILTTALCCRVAYALGQIEAARANYSCILKWSPADAPK